MWDAALAGLGHGDARARLPGRLRGFAEWPALLQASRSHRLTPLVFAGLAQIAGNGIGPPAPAWRQFQRETIRLGVRLVRLEQAGAQIVGQAARAGIPLLVLKGLALSATVYPAGVPRPMDDIDLLVREADLAGLTEILHAAGYRNDLRGEEDFFPPTRAFSFDVHTALVNITRVPARRALWPVSFDDLWMRRQPFSAGGRLLHTLGPLDTIIHLALHAVHHHGLAGRLWMADLLACLGRSEIDPRELGKAVPAAQRSLWYCLESLAAAGALPPGWRHRVPAQRPGFGDRRLLTMACRGTLPEAARYAFTFSCLPDWRSKRGFLRQILFPCSDRFRTGFSDAGNTSPRWVTLWRMALGLAGRLALHSGHRPSRE